VLVPKADSAELLASVHRQFENRIGLLPLVETARGLLAATELATTRGVLRLVLGHLDLCADLGLDPTDHAQLVPGRFALVVASAAAGLSGPVDSVTVEVRSQETVAADTRRALAAGFTARLCLHPDQVDVVHAALAPSEDEVAWATSVLEVARRGAIGLHEGRMVDRPVVLRAQSVLVRARLPVRKP